MARNLVVQFYIDSRNFKEPSYNNIGSNDELLHYSLKSAKAYAERISADYKLVDRPVVNWKHPTFERLDLFYNDSWWQDYDQILYVDTDVLLWPCAPSVFDMYPNLETFKPVFDKRALRSSLDHQWSVVKGTCLEKFDLDLLRKKRFNAGVFVVTKNAAKLMRQYLDCEKLDSDDNSMLIYAMLESGVPVDYMDPMFNKKNGGPNFYFGHAFGQEKFKKSFTLIDEAKKLFD